MQPTAPAAPKCLGLIESSQDLLASCTGRMINGYSSTVMEKDNIFAPWARKKCLYHSMEKPCMPGFTSTVNQCAKVSVVGKDMECIAIHCSPFTLYHSTITLTLPPSRCPACAPCTAPSTPPIRHCLFAPSFLSLPQQLPSHPLPLVSRGREGGVLALARHRLEFALAQLQQGLQKTLWTGQRMGSHACASVFAGGVVRVHAFVVVFAFVLPLYLYLGHMLPGRQHPSPVQFEHVLRT